MVIGVVVFVYYSGNEGKEVYVDYTIREAVKVQKEVDWAQALRSLKARDPQFSEAAFLTRAEKAFLQIQKGWCDHNLGLSQAFLSDGVMERFGIQIQEQKDAGVHDRMDNLQVLEKRISQIQSDKNFDTIHVFIRASSIDYEEDLKTKKRVRGGGSEEEFEEYWSFLRKPGAKTLAAGKGGLIEGNCPNCGAQIEAAATAKCKYCQAYLRSGEYDWVLSEITQASEWSINEGRRVPGLAKLVQEDPGFNLQHIEDRSSVVFWRFTTANRLGQVAPLRKMCREEYCGRLAKEVDYQSDGRRTYYGDCAVGSVDVRGVEIAEPMDRVFVEIRWSGMPVLVKVSQPKPTVMGETINFHHGYILNRKHGVKTDVRTALVSSHCPSCGAPEGKTEAAACEYCGMVVNDGAFDWVLDTIVPATSGEFCDAIKVLKASEQKGGSPDSDPGIPSIPGPGGSARKPSPAQAGGFDFGKISIGGQECLRWVVKMMMADGIIEDKERDYLKDFATRTGVPASKLDSIISDASSGNPDLPIPEDQSESKELLRAIAGMALADGRLSPEETQILNHFGSRIGLAPIDVSMLVKQERNRLFTLAKKTLEVKKTIS